MSRPTGNKGATDTKKVSGELFTLTYGALVAQLLKDYENDEEANHQLERMGYNIGIRLIEDLLARSNIGRCNDFRETADIIAKHGFKTFLGISPQVTGWNATGDEFSLIIDNNPLAEFVELPEGHNNLWYSSILIGAIKGALEMVQMEVEAGFIQDVLKGDPTTEVRVKFIKKLEDAVPAGEE
eukprot:gene665-1333_t